MLGKLEVLYYKKSMYSWVKNVVRGNGFSVLN